MSNSNITALFPNPDASSIVELQAAQIVAPMVNGEGMTPDEMMTGGGVRVIKFLIDGSSSMSPIAPTLRNLISDDLPKSIMGASEDDIAALRLGGAVFSDDITPIWGKKDPEGNGSTWYHAPINLPRLESREYSPETQGGMTSLYRCILEETPRAVLFADRLQAESGTQPDIDIMVISDGLNNMHPRNPDQVRTMVQGADKTRVRFCFFYFDTDVYNTDKASIEHREREIRQMPFMAKPGETKQELHERLRRFLQMVSKTSASKGMSAVQAAACFENDII